jgi:hypothetical protein
MVCGDNDVRRADRQSDLKGITKPRLAPWLSDILAAQRQSMTDCTRYPRHYDDNQGYCFGCGKPTNYEYWLADRGFWNKGTTSTLAEFQAEVDKWLAAQKGKA